MISPAHVLREPANQPHLSVIIPVYNDIEGLRTTVGSLLTQTADDFEIVIVDNMSTDGTKSVARQLANRSPLITMAVEDERQSSYAARNTGIEIAAGDILAFLDADTWVEPDYVESLHNVMTDQVYVGCNVEVVLENRTCAGRYNQATGFPVEKYLTEVGYAPTCCLVVDREVFNAVGRFDGCLISSGDVEFGRRVQDEGYELKFVPDVTIYHPARSSVGSLVSKRVRIGRGKAQLARRYPDRFEDDSSIRKYLPLNPLNFWKEYSTQVSDVREWICWYLLATFLKYSQGYGNMKERIK